MIVGVKSDCGLANTDYFYTFPPGRFPERFPRMGCTCDVCTWNWKRLQTEIDKATHIAAADWSRFSLGTDDWKR